jgi:hypothetical protein
MDKDTVAKIRQDHEKRREYGNSGAIGMGNLGIPSPFDGCAEPASAAPMEYKAQRPRTSAEQMIYDLSERAYSAKVQEERAKAALSFFGEHPEFAQFIALIRSGSISI